MLCSCFKNLDLFDLQTLQFDFSRSTAFVIFTSCGLKLWVKSLHPKHRCSRLLSKFYRFYFWLLFFHIYNVGSIFLTKYLMCFNGIEMLDTWLNNYYANLFFCYFILYFTNLKKTPSASGWIMWKNFQSESFSIYVLSFVFFILSLTVCPFS